jgi:TetR/AcrR family transcriptional regulator, mexJK operon transcriptional repressor
LFARIVNGLDVSDHRAHTTRDEDRALNFQDTRCVAPQRGRGRPKVLPDETRRSALVELAMHVFTELGYGRTTMDVVASRAHVSKQTLYRFFPNKPALFAAVIEHHRQSMLGLPGNYDGMPLDQALATIFRADLDDAADDEHMLLVSVIMAESIRYPEVLEVVEAHGAEPARADLAAWIRRETERGRLRADEDADALAGILMDMIYGASECHRFRLCREKSDAGVRRAHVLRCIRVFLGGVATG